MTKKITSAIVIGMILSFATLNAPAQLSGYYLEDFEGTFPPTGWRVVNVLDPNYTWAQSPFFAYSGTHSAYTGSAFGQGEDWLILPQFTIKASDVFSFRLAVESLGFNDSTIVLVSTTDTKLSSFKTVLGTLSDGVNYPNTTNTFKAYVYSLSAFAGKNIYVALKNRNVEGDGVYVDLVSIGAPRLSYCISKGLNASQDWIDLVKLGTIQNRTGNDSGYADYTNLKTNLAQGSTDTIAVSGAFAGTYNELWKVWIDYNHNGDFSDPGEQVASFKSSSAGLLLQSFTVPSTAKTGITKMRVSMKKGLPAQSPCDIFDRGEVEDYAVNITPAQLNASTNIIDKSAGVSVLVSNASTNFIIITMHGFTGVENIEMYNLTGQLIKSSKQVNTTQYKMDVSTVHNGVYVLRISDNAGHIKSINWVKQ